MKTHNKINKAHKFIFVLAIVFVLLLVFSLQILAADKIVTGDYLTIGTKTYKITDAKSLVDADLALIEWRSKGVNTAITGVLSGEEVSGFSEAYAKVYRMLLDLFNDKSDTSVVYYDISPTNTGSNKYITSECPGSETKESTVLWKISGNVPFEKVKTIYGTGRIIIISEDNATIYLNSSDAQFYLKGTGVLSIQGMSADKKVTLTSTIAERSKSAIDVYGGNLYLEYCDLNGFEYTNSVSVIRFPEADAARYLYMSDSSLQNISASEAPGIFCKAFASTNTNVKKSKLYINYSVFKNCVTVNGNSNTAGGSAIRSYAADQCKLEVRNCLFEGNRVGSKTTAQNGTGTGGGAIYWKSVAGSATLINCTFKNNHSSVVGGAILNMGTMDIIGCHFEGNTALKNGGAIAVETPYTSNEYDSITDVNSLSGSLNLDSNTKIISNTANGIGGGIYFNAVFSQIGDDCQIMNYEMELNINGALISGNTAATHGGGVGIYMNYEDREYETGVTIEEGSIVSNNTAGENGGAIWINSATNCDCKENLGVIMNGGSLDNNSATNGGAIYIETGKADVEMNYYINGGTVSNNTASENGGAAYIFGGNVIMSGGTVTNCTAQINGGAISVAGGEFAISGGLIEKCQSFQSGGSVYVSGGDATMTGGKIEKSNALLGGAVYVSGGNANVNGGEITECTANKGGAIYVVGGTVKMLGGRIYKNKAINGSGGAIYVTGTVGLEVIVKSGEITENSATKNGGAICVIGQSTEKITVQIGVNAVHDDSLGSSIHYGCDHNEDIDGNGNCPKVENNVSTSEGGALFISGTKQTQLNIFCIKESGNRGNGNPAASTETSLSDFLKVDGGSVLISSLDENDNSNCGFSEIYSSIHVTGGDLSIEGTLANPAILAPITVDVLASGGSYNDTRTNSSDSNDIQYYVVKYFENYEDEKTGFKTGQYSVYQTPQNQPHTVWGVIYSHQGLTIIGWNTKEDGSGKKFGVSTVIEYDDFKDYLDSDGITLAMYAIWEKDFYWIKFEPNANSFAGSMGDGENKVSFLCGAETTDLPINQYINWGYKFLGWSTDKNATEPMYEDSEKIIPLSQKYGEVITVYAVWELCEHNDTSEYVFTKDSDDTMTCTCCCYYYVSVKLNAPIGATYNKDEHLVTPTFTDNSDGKFNKSFIDEFMNLPIVYTIDEQKQDPINAGHYKASVEIAGITVFVEFDISKAYQSAPSKPVFAIQETEAGSILVIQSPGNVKGEAETQVHYKMVHNNHNGEDIETPWQIELSFGDFESSWTLYYIVAYYPGNDNYFDSEEIISDQKYIFQGNIHIIIVNGEGIAFTQPQEGENNKVAFITESKTDYYLTKNYTATLTTVDIKDSKGNAVEKSKIENYFVRTVDVENGIFSYVVNAFEQGYSGSITIEFSGAKHNPTTSSSVAPNECFGSISNTVTEIGSDSAFTVLFEIGYYDSTVYQDLKITFDSALPKNTTVIMMDKIDGSLWYTTITKDNTKSIDITSFKPMGGGDDQLDFSRDVLRYQFIVDFSDVENNSLSELNINLVATVNNSYAPELPNAESIVSIVPITHTLKKPTTNGNNMYTEIEYAQGAENSSKWDDRELSLVIIPNAATKLELPIDASIKIIETVGSQIKTTIANLNDNGCFVVTLNRDTSDLQITLQSQMFPDDGEYTFTIELYAAYDGNSPMNGILLATHQDIILNSVKAPKNAVNIKVSDDSRIYNIETGKIEAIIDIELSEGYTATVTLMKKDERRGYISTAWSEQLKTGSNEIMIENLNSFSEGLFFLTVVIRDSSNTPVMTVPYYFIIQK